MLRFISPFKSFFKLMKSFEISNILSKISHTPSYLCIVIDSLPSEDEWQLDLGEYEIFDATLGSKLCNLLILTLILDFTILGWSSVVKFFFENITPKALINPRVNPIPSFSLLGGKKSTCLSKNFFFLKLHAKVISISKKRI